MLFWHASFREAGKEQPFYLTTSLVEEHTNTAKERRACRLFATLLEDVQEVM